MDLFGIGPLELVVVLLVAIMVLGPARMVEVATSLGKFWREAQRLLRETADAATSRMDAPLVLGGDEIMQEEPGKPEGAVASDGTGGDEAPDQPQQEAGPREP